MLLNLSCFLVVTEVVFLTSVTRSLHTDNIDLKNWRVYFLCFNIFHDLVWIEADYFLVSESQSWSICPTLIQELKDMANLLLGLWSDYYPKMKCRRITNFLNHPFKLTLDRESYLLDLTRESWWTPSDTELATPQCVAAAGCGGWWRRAATWWSPHPPITPHG